MTSGADCDAGYGVAIGSSGGLGDSANVPASAAVMDFEHCGGRLRGIDVFAGGRVSGDSVAAGWPAGMGGGVDRHDEDQRRRVVAVRIVTCLEWR